jgi:uncharacterized protein
MSSYKSILNKIKVAINSISPRSEIYLFGSRAKKTANKESDWDILILIDSTVISFELEKTIIDLLYEIEIETGEVISPLIYSKNEWNKKYLLTSLFESINQDGIKIE